MSEEIKKVKSVFLGKEVRQYWDIDKYYYLEPRIIECKETIGRKKVLEKDLNFEFNEKEEIYLPELNRYTTVEKKTRSTDGSIVYNITYVTDVVVDEDSKQSTEEILKVKMEEYNKEKAEREKREIDLKNKNEEKEKRYNKILEDRKNVTDIKGVFIQKVPLDRDGRPMVNNEILKELHFSLLESLPKNYLLISSILDVKFYDLVGNKKKMIKNIEDNIGKDNSDKVLVD